MALFMVGILPWREPEMGRRPRVPEVRHSGLPAGLGFRQPAAAKLLFRDVREIGLEVEHRSAVEHVDAPDGENPAFASQELDDRERQRIRPARGAGGENAVRPVIRGRYAHPGLREIAGAVEDPQHVEVREPFDVLEAGLVLGQDFNRPFRPVLRPQPLGDLASRRVGRVDGADRAKGEGGGR